MFCFGLRKRLDAIDAEKARPALQIVLDQYNTAKTVYDRSYVVSDVRPGFTPAGGTQVVGLDKFISTVLNPVIIDWVSRHGGIKALQAKLPAAPIPEPVFWTPGFCSPNYLETITVPAAKPRKKKAKKK